MNNIVADMLPGSSALTSVSDSNAIRSRTLKTSIGCSGIGLHSGAKITMVLHPAEAGTGIRFRRVDIAGGGAIVPAIWSAVHDTRMNSCLKNDDGVVVGTVEHLMAALSALSIDNALIEVDGPELPILDGSAAPFVFLLDCAGSVEQDAPARVIEVRRTVRVQQGEAWAELRPLGPAARAVQPVLEMDLSIDFAASAIGRQSASLRLTADSFRHEIASARTFAHADEVVQLQAAGLALGGSLDNAIVVDGANILNPGGLRMDAEFARHKLLDAVGDLALAGGRLHGRYVAHRTGHDLNNRLLRALFADAAALRVVTTDPLMQAA